MSGQKERGSVCNWLRLELWLADLHCLCLRGDFLIAHEVHGIIYSTRGNKNFPRATSSPTLQWRIIQARDWISHRRLLILLPSKFNRLTTTTMFNRMFPQLPRMETCKAACAVKKAVSGPGDRYPSKNVSINDVKLAWSAGGVTRLWSLNMTASVWQSMW